MRQGESVVETAKDILSVLEITQSPIEIIEPKVILAHQ